MRNLTENSDPVELHILADLAEFELGLSGAESILDAPAASTDLIIPGCADFQVASIERIGYRGRFPAPSEWESLLSMLEPGQELLWIVTKRPTEGFAYYLALKSDPQPQQHPTRTAELRAGFRSILGQFAMRSFPESLAKECETSEATDLLEGILQHANGEVVVTSGLPSPPTLEDGREFQEQNEHTKADGSLNNIVEPFAGESAFSIVFTVGRATPDTANAMLSGMVQFRSLISPFLKVQEGKNQSSSIANTEGTQDSKGATRSQTAARNPLSAFVQKLLGSRTDKILAYYSREKRGEGTPSSLNDLVQASHWKTGGFWRGAAMTSQESSTQTTTVSTTKTLQEGASTTITRTDAMLELLDQKLQDSIRSLKKAAGTGAFFLGAEVFSPKTELSLRIGRSISGSLAGARTHLRPFQTALYKGEAYASHLITAASLSESYPAITVQSRHLAALFLPVPESDLPGLRTKRNVFYGKPNASPVDEQAIDDAHSRKAVWLGDLAHLKGNFIQANLAETGSEFRIPAEDLTSHLLIAGTTGSGKTQRAASILNQLPKDQFQIVVIESAKKTYRGLLQRNGVATRVLELGGSDASALRINPFYFEPGTSLKRHISIFSDALADLLPVEALIGPKLREAIQNCYMNYQWDIEGACFRGDDAPVYPSMVDLHSETMAVASALRYGPELASNYKGALLGRTRLFIDELYQDIFGWGGARSIDELLGEDDVIIELDSLPPSEAKMPSFVLSLLLERIRSRQHQAKAPGQLPRRDIILVIEEAHNLLEKSMEGNRSQQEMGSGGFLLKQIVRLLQEGREAGMGIMVVDQSPASLADAVIRNTNTKIILRITDSEEAERIGTTLGLTKEECRDLHDLEDGEAVVKVKNAGKALKLSPAPLVARRPPPCEVSTSTPPSPDYYRAAKASQSIRAIFGSNAQRPGPERIRELVAEVLSAAGTNAEARRFLGQKLMASVSEARDTCLPGLLAGVPDGEELAWTIIRAAELPEMAALVDHLKLLLSPVPWEDAEGCFKPAVLPLLPPLETELRKCPHWAAYDGARQFVDLARSILAKDFALREPSESYSLLLSLIHGSPDRAEWLRQISSKLNPTPRI